MYHFHDTRHGPLAYLLAVEGPALILLHGNTVTAQTQERLAARFTDEHRVYSIDLLGHGRSARPDGLFSTRYFAMQGEALADFLIGMFPDQRVPVFGMSAGGLTALNAACIVPERFAALIIDGAFRYVEPSIVEAHRERFGTISREWEAYLIAQHGEEWWPRLSEGLLHMMIELEAAGTDLVPCLEQISIPALILQGGRDRFCPEPQCRQLAERMQRARLIYDPEAGHLLAWQDPDAFREHVRSFLREVGQQ